MNLTRDQADGFETTHRFVTRGFNHFWYRHQIFHTWPIHSATFGTMHGFLALSVGGVVHPLVIIECLHMTFYCMSDSTLFVADIFNIM